MASNNEPQPPQDPNQQQQPIQEEMDPPPVYMMSPEEAMKREIFQRAMASITMAHLMEADPRQVLNQAHADQIQAICRKVHQYATIASSTFELCEAEIAAVMQHRAERG